MSELRAFNRANSIISVHLSEVVGLARGPSQEGHILTHTYARPLCDV